MQITKSQLINNPEKLRRHIVILGAGASVAAFQTGDANGKRLPTMPNLIEMLDLEPVLKQGGVEYKSSNFEDIYSELYESNPESHLLKEIEEIVYDYFNSLKLPDVPTLYDHLLLSLRPKDMIATFNWDPFLFDAWNRNKDKIPVPEIIHLHGNVRLAYCSEHQAYGEHGMYCPICDRELIPSQLLYPRKEKSYRDPFIKTEWEVLKKGLSQAMTLTIFGYGAPNSDKEAVDILNSIWDKDSRFIERTEIIDIKGKDELRSQWESFIIRTYFNICDSFYSSRLACFPRRTCEALIHQTVYGQFVENNPFPLDADFDALMSWLSPSIEAEEKICNKKTDSN